MLYRSLATKINRTWASTLQVCKRGGGRFFECFHNANHEMSRLNAAKKCTARAATSGFEVKFCLSAAFAKLPSMKYITRSFLLQICASQTLCEACSSTGAHSTLTLTLQEIGPLKVGGGRTFPETMAPACGPNNHEKSSFPVVHGWSECCLYTVRYA